MSELIINCNVDELNENGRFLIDTAVMQSEHLAAILAPNPYGRFSVCISSVPGMGDAIRVRVTSTKPQIKVWSVSHQVYSNRIRKGELSGTAVINAIGAELRQWLADGKFTVWVNPDWVSQTEAARAVSVAATTIRNAVRDGRLQTWRDTSEPNPRKQTRVRLSQVKRIWGTD